jgi:hypothetical protein
MVTFTVEFASILDGRGTCNAEPITLCRASRVNLDCPDMNWHSKTSQTTYLNGMFFHQHLADFQVGGVKALDDNSQHDAKIVAHRNGYIHDFFNPTFLGHECMDCSSFYDLIFKVQGPIKVDMFSWNLEVVGLGGRIGHISQLQARRVATEDAVRAQSAVWPRIKPSSNGRDEPPTLSTYWDTEVR